ncbi:MAG: ATP-binding protein [Silvibacterium sp.]|nr:ATP-binding protein [Silvibacterium sp.]
MKSTLAIIAISTLTFLLGSSSVLALDPSLEVSQYAHTAWTFRDGFSVGNIFAIAQTSDGYLWLGGEAGLFRFDGVRATPWQPPGLQPADRFVFRLLGARDGTLWIGTFHGLLSWNGATLTRYPVLDERVVGSLIEDHEGTIWAGTWPGATPPTRLCAIRGGSIKCYGDDGAFGKAVSALYEDSAGTLWASAETGLWRWKPGPPKRESTEPLNVSAISEADNRQTLIATYGAGLVQLAGDKFQAYPVRGATDSNRLLLAREIDSNKLLRDRDGGLWIGTVAHGLIHVHHGKTDVFTKSDGLSGDIILSLFEDREGNVWVATAGGLDRFREFPVTSVSSKQGLASDQIASVLAATDGSVWVGTHDGLTNWKNGQTTTFHKASGLPDDHVQSLFQDGRGRIWAFTDHGLAYFSDGRFVAVNARLPSQEVYSITGDNAGNLWLSGNNGLSHLVEGRLVEHFPWSTLGRRQQAKVIISDHGGVWLAFWIDGGVLYFKDAQVRASYTAASGLAKGLVASIRLDPDGAAWAASQEGGVSRIKDGHIATLTSRNGLPCDTIHWSIEDDDRALWLYTACGLVRIAHSELDAWIADPQHRVQTTVWDAGDGVRLRFIAPSAYGPTVAKSADGKLWFLTGEGLQVVDPHRLAFNKLPPPVHIEQIVADHKIYWKNLPGAEVTNVRLSALTRDLEIDYAALSLDAPEKVRFKYKLEGQDSDWREVVNDRQVQYSNLAPRHYRFRVRAANSSGVWNEEGAFLDFSVAPAYWQTNWFRALCAISALALLWVAYQWRLRRLHHQFEMTLDARVTERTRIARELHDTLLQSFHGVLLRLQAVSQLMRERPIEAQEKLDSTIDLVAEAITEGRDAVQGLRESTVQSNDLAQAISTLGEELASDATGQRPAFRVSIEGAARDLHPILRDEIYRIAAEALRNAFRHAQARKVEVEIRYDDDQFRLRLRDDGKGIDPAVLSRQDKAGHYGLDGMRERATLIGGKLTVWSEVDAGTEVELRIPAGTAYTIARRGSWLSRTLAGKTKA